MLFRVCEQYNDEEVLYNNNNNNNNNNNILDVIECFICFETISINELNQNKLSNQSIFFKICDCDGNIHNRCLKMWFDTHKSCPICRNNVIEKNCISFLVVKYLPFGNYIYLGIYNFLFIYIKIIFLFIYYIKIIFLFIFIYNMFYFY